MDFSPEQIRLIFQGIIFLILSIAVHEYGHAIVADKLGDRLPRSQGRTTLNPAAHADPIGTLAFPLAALVVTKGASLGFGWGKPVMVNPVSFTRKLQMRTAHMLVAAAGPAMNIVLALLVTSLHLALTKFDVIQSEAAHRALMYAGMLNFGLAVFNCIPAKPLDGGSIVEGFLPNRLVPKWQEISVYGPFILMAFIMVPALRNLLGRATFALYDGWTGVIGLPEAIAMQMQGAM